jgi:hypothetical protein
VDAPITRRGAGASRSWRARAGAFELCGTTPRHFEKHGSLVELAPHWRPFRRPQRRTPDDDPALSAAQLGHRDHDVQRWQAPGPADPIIPFIEGDGTGPDIWRASVRVIDAAVEKAYGGKRKIHWHEVLAGEKAFNKTGNWLPDQTLADFQEVPRRHQGPADHARRRRHPLPQRRAAPDARSLRLPAPRALVQGRALPVKRPQECDMTIFRENTEDIYAGIEIGRRHPRGRRRSSTSSPRRIPSPRTSRRSASPTTQAPSVGIGIKPVSKDGSERLVGRHRVRPQGEAQERHARPQGQHHEVHRGCLQGLGLRPRRAKPSASHHRARVLDPRQQGRQRDLSARPTPRPSTPATT